MTPNQSRRHHSPKGNRWCVDDELLALMLEMIVSLNSTLSHNFLYMMKEGFEWKATWVRLEIKILVVGLECLGLNI